MLGVEPAKSVTPPHVAIRVDKPEATRVPVHQMHTPTGYTVPRISRRNYDKAALEADIREGNLKASTIAEKYGVEVSTVYVIKSRMKKEGRAGPIEPKPTAPIDDDEEAEDDMAEEEDDEDEEDVHDPFMGNRGRVAGGEI